MKEPGLVSCQQPVHRYKRGGHEHIAIPNHLGGQVAMTEPDQGWCGDVTYIRTGKRRAYLAVVPDLFARKPVGRVMSFSPDSKLTTKAPEMAWKGSISHPGSCSTVIRVATIQAGSSDSYYGDTESGKV